MHVWYVLAFICLAAAAIVAGIQRTYTLTLIAAGLTLWLVPAAFQLH
jgi:hypothetical protein